MSNSVTDRTGAHPAPEAGEKFDRLKTLLREMFQLDRGDLDFGLYRIMNMKAGEIEAFLERDLLPQVKTILAGVADEEREQIETNLDKTIKQLEALKAPVEDNEGVLELREQLAKAKADAEVEADAYNHLANFFARYYTQGDFMSLRRYSGGGRTTYLIPYDGEEVKLHWANADQYYIKTTENYASYAFTVGEGDAECRVRFEIDTADNEKDNVKEAEGKQRRFVLGSGEGAVIYDEDDLVIRFEHRPLTEGEKKIWTGNGARQQSRINEVSAKWIFGILEKSGSDFRNLLVAPAPTEANPERSVLAKHIERYTAKNSFDYFIHKDLNGFLHQELDLYLKTEVLNLDDLALGDTERLRRALARMRAVRYMAGKIIVFLAQLENFQKSLWLKKKFVLETQWCVTLDRVPEALYPEIAANESQRKEWVELFAIDEITGDVCNGGIGYSEPLKTAFLKANPYLMLDTRHFDADFKARLLTALSDAGPLDEQMDGLLVHSENFQALNLLQTRYSGAVQCVYIDPPYNSPSSEILYKNNFKHSSWVTLIENRLQKSDVFRSVNGSLVIAIDEHERERLGSLLLQTYSSEDIFLVSMIHNKKGIQGDMFSVNNDYAYFVIPEQRKSLNKLKIPPEEWEYSNLRNWGGESLRTDARNCFYPIFVRDGAVEGFGDVCDDDFHPPSANVDMEGGVVAVYPIDKRGIERKWRYARNSVEGIKDMLKVKENGKNGIAEILKPQTEAQIKTVWDDKRHIAGDFGTKLLTDMALSRKFDYPKSVHTVYDTIYIITDTEGIVLDYFAGSGTTGHAVINLNREDGGERKYILVEMGDHFDAVLLPRLKKVVYAPDWKHGKPVTRHKGMTQLIQYHRLESYEDTLDGLVLTPPDGDLLADNDPALVEDYRLRYALGEETATSPCLLGSHFTDPFAYTLSVVRDGARRETPVDLPETFNYLLGLRVESYRRIDDVLTIAGKNPQGQYCLILWRNLETMDNKTLENWFMSNRGQLPQSFDLAYVNGDHTLNAIRKPGETWAAKTIEPLFRELMFEVQKS